MKDKPSWFVICKRVILISLLAIPAALLWIVLVLELWKRIAS